MNMLLRVDALSGGYGGAPIFQSISIYVQQGEIVTIAGTNGAGKSTLAKGIMNLLPRLAGSVTLDGNEISKLPTEERIKMGMAYVPQVANIFGGLSVEDNLLALEVGSRVRKTSQKRDEIYARFPNLASRRRQNAGTLSGGERQQLAFARALLTDPKLMILDEPSAALSPASVDDMFELIKQLPKLGIAVLMVEQRAREALNISDRGYILDLGNVAATGSAAELLSDDRIANLYLGKSKQH